MTFQYECSQLWGMMNTQAEIPFDPSYLPTLSSWSTIPPTYELHINKYESIQDKDVDRMLRLSIRAENEFLALFPTYLSTQKKFIVRLETQYGLFPILFGYTSGFIHKCGEKGIKIGTNSTIVYTYPDEATRDLAFDRAKQTCDDIRAKSKPFMDAIKENEDALAKISQETL